MIWEKLTSFIDSEKGLSTTVSHAIGYGVLIILVGTLVLNISGAYDNREEAVQKNELDRINNKVASEIQKTDNYVSYAKSRTGNNNEITVERRVSITSSIGSAAYSTTIIRESPNEIRVISETTQVTREKVVTLENEFTSSGYGGGKDMVVEYDSGSNQIEINEVGS